MPLRFVLGDDAGRERVDKVLARLVEGTSRGELQRWIREGRVLVDGRRCEPKTEVGRGAVLLVEPAAPPTTTLAPDSDVPFGVLFEDASLIVVDKPAGVVVHPAKGNWTGSLVAGLLARSGFSRAPSDERDPQGALRPGVVHRIDKDTSGVLVVAKTREAREGLKTQFGAHHILRRYVGITLGVPAPGRISTFYGRHPHARTRFSSKVTQGKLAVTEVRVEEELAGGRAALVECTLETGRTHQIRVHLAEQRGTPLLADGLYGRVSRDLGLAAAAEAIGRQALHAAVLGFTHPVTGESLRFESALPDDFQRALASLRAARA